MSSWSRSRLRITAVVASAVAAVAVCSASGPVGVAATSTSNWPAAAADAADSNRNAGETALTASGIAAAGFGGFAPAYSLAVLPPFGSCSEAVNGRARPVVSDGRLFFFDGRYLNAYVLATGVRAWRTDLGGRFGAIQGNELAVAGGKVLLAANGGCQSQSDPSGIVYALDAATGARKWTKVAGGNATDLTISGTTVVVATTFDVFDEGLRAYNLGNGALKWTRNDCGTNDTFLVATTLVTHVCGNLNVNTGVSLWNKAGWTFIRGDGPDVSDPAIYAKNLSGQLVALRPGGGIKWTATGSYQTVYAAGPVRLFTRCDQDRVCAVSRTTGARQYRLPIEFTVPTGMIAASDFAVTTFGSFIRANNGVEVGSLINGNGNVGDWDFVAIADGHLVAAGAATVDVWEFSP